MSTGYTRVTQVSTGYTRVTRVSTGEGVDEEAPQRRIAAALYFSRAFIASSSSANRLAPNGYIYMRRALAAPPDRPSIMNHRRHAAEVYWCKEARPGVA